MTIQDQPRRRNLATIVGSSLAVVAAGSLLVFSSLAERAGLDGLAAGGLQPTHPGRSGGGARPITIPAPATAPPGDPRTAFTALVRAPRTHRDDGAPEARVAFVPPRDLPAGVDQPERHPQPKRPDRLERRARVAVAGPNVAKNESPDGPPDGPPYGPPYGHAYGYHRTDGERPKPAQRKGPGERAPKKQSHDGPVRARKASDKATSAKPPKVEKAPKVQAPKGKAKGPSKRSPGNGNGKAKGHAKHGKGKAKGHSKHGG